MAKRKKKATAAVPVESRAPERKQGVQMTMMDYLTTVTNSANRKRLRSSRDIPSTTPGGEKSSVNANTPNTPVTGSTRNSYASSVSAASSSSSASASTSTSSARKVQLIVISSDEEDSPTPPPFKKRRVSPHTPISSLGTAASSMYKIA